MKVHRRAATRPAIVSAAIAACLSIVAGTAVAAGPTGYVVNNEGHYVRDSAGQCVRTSQWVRADANAQCDPGLMAKVPESVPMAAVETAPPAPKTVLKPITLGADAYFAFNGATLTTIGQHKLNDIVATLKKDVKEPQIHITGYTDRIGSKPYNQKLSLRRAEAVKSYLVSKGIPTSYITVTGAGDASPVVSCHGKRGNALIGCLAPNRRTVVDFSAFEEVK
ncbi:MAG: hypothetical protein B7Z66_05715 [Chromatiales bacterium 21-64-14]|nr:MAG: hypothetical protein B7Z66_05715 [Chromatiales bacterium 21-64-14]HQU15201.1 OmpA family protein [Gammaproteobacteria bacterium]